MPPSRTRVGHTLLNAVALVAIAASLAVVCYLYLIGKSASGDQRPEPLNFEHGQAVRIVCLSHGGSQGFTDGSNVIRYSGEERLVIKKIDLVDGQGLRVVEALAVPLKNRAVGSWAGWPPPNAESALAHAIPAVGARMSRDGVTQLNLVVHLVRTKTDQPIRAGALRIFYSLGDEEWGSVAPVRTGIESAGACR